MEQYKQEFINFMVESEVLKFGEFTLKSGRKSPFFMNAGAYVTGTQLRRLGEYYAKAIHDNYTGSAVLKTSPSEIDNILVAVEVALTPPSFPAITFR